MSLVEQTSKYNKYIGISEFWAGVLRVDSINVPATPNLNEPFYRICKFLHI